MVSGYVYIHLAQRKAISVRPGQLPRHGGEGQQGHHRPGEGDDHLPLRLKVNSNFTSGSLLL